MLQPARSSRCSRNCHRIKAVDGWNANWAVIDARHIPDKSRYREPSGGVKKPPRGGIVKGIVKLRLTAVSDPQHGGFSADSNPVSGRSIDELFVNLTVPARGLTAPAYVTPVTPVARLEVPPRGDPSIHQRLWPVLRPDRCRERDALDEHRKRRPCVVAVGRQPHGDSLDRWGQ